MHVEHRRPMYAVGVLAMVSALLIGQSLPGASIIDLFVGPRGGNPVQVASGHSLMAPSDDSGAARDRPAVTVREPVVEPRSNDRRTPPRSTRPGPAGKPVPRAPGRSDNSSTQAQVHAQAPAATTTQAEHGKPARSAGRLDVRLKSGGGNGRDQGHAKGHGKSGAQDKAKKANGRAGGHAKGKRGHRR